MLMLELRIPHFSIGAIRLLRDLIPSRPPFILQASSKSAGLDTAMSAPLPAWWSLVKDQPCTPRTLYGQWVCTHFPNGATAQKRAARGTWPEERGAAARLVTLAFGMYFPAG